MNLRPGLLATVVSLGLFVDAPARACGWDDEVYLAEEKTLPCMGPALYGNYVSHTPQYYEARLAAAKQVLRADPFNTWALDMGSIALLKLGKLAEAEAMMNVRAKIEPDAYATHANLGTLHTFDGRFGEALTHIDQAMKIEPKAHFGREKYHRALVVYLRDLATDPSKASQNFLGVPVTDADRRGGSPQKFDAVMTAAGYGRDAFDALIAMITVYGAADNPHVYATAGDLLALYGNFALGSVAYARAAQLKHPAATKMRSWSKLLQTRFPKGDEGSHAHSPEELLYIAKHPESVPRKSEQKEYAKLETDALRKGLAVWTHEGLETLYREQEKWMARCPVGKTFRDLGDTTGTETP